MSNLSNLKVLVIFGTRPEAIKMAPVVAALKKKSAIQTKVLVTAQHRGMLDQVLKIFDIKPDFDLNIMTPNQTLVELESRIILKVDEILKKEKPDLVLVHGDTTTAQASAMATYFNQIDIGHVEAGLRTFDKYNPFPEEMNRTVIDSIADLLFAPTQWARENLLKEGKDKDRIFVTGNTVVDALLDVASRDYEFENPALKKPHSSKNKKILLTTHRRENLGETLENIHKAHRRIVDEYDDVEIIFPVHPNPRVIETAQKILGNHDRVHLVDPLSYIDIIKLMKESHLVVTDSGGLQEEAPSLGKPVLVLRKTTERPEGIDAGTVKLVGVEPEEIVRNIKLLLDDTAEYEKMSKAINPYGDGKAAERIVAAIETYYGK